MTTFYCEGKAPTHRRIDLEGLRLRDKDVWRDRGRVGRKRVNGETVLRPTRVIRGERTPGGWLDPDKPGGIELLCPTCGRNPVISEEKLNLLTAAGLAEVNICSLPF